MVRLIIAERAKGKGDFFKEVDPEQLTDIGLGQVIYEAKQMIEQLEELHFKMDEDAAA